MKLAEVEQIAKAVLYEGYMLYPYRPSSVKNQQRWNFGVLYPPSYARAQAGSDAYLSQTECLVQAHVDCRIEVRVRFLHLVSRTLDKQKQLRAPGQVARRWQDAEEREVVLSFRREELLAGAVRPFHFPSARREELERADGGVSGSIVRENETVEGSVEISAEQIEQENPVKLTIRVRNSTEFNEPTQKTRDQALTRSLLSAHVILGVSGGEFVSLLETPDSLRALASSCHNIGTWPVLVGDPGDRDTMLSSPIILYDYPQVAPESSGDLFDGTEIDEILSLRIMTMTDAEKREMCESDELARQMLERTEALSPEQFMKLHGVIRSLRLAKEVAS